MYWLLQNRILEATYEATVMASLPFKSMIWLQASRKLRHESTSLWNHSCFLHGRYQQNTRLFCRCGRYQPYCMDLTCERDERRDLARLARLTRLELKARNDAMKKSLCFGQIEISNSNPRSRFGTPSRSIPCLG